MTPLEKPIKRALKISGQDYVITLTPAALKITRKAHRLGVELKWADIVSGESALAMALNASLGQLQHEAAPGPKVPVRRRPPAKAAAGARTKSAKRGAPGRGR
jgi:hypothetical protein